MFAHIADEYSRGWGHITTRQNLQFHFVPLERVPAVMRDLASVGLTTREACGDTVRNVQGCHLAGACPYEVLDISAVGRGGLPPLPAQPARPAPAPQVQDQLLGLRHRLRPGDVQRRRRHRRPPARHEDGTVEPGFRVFVAGGLGANPHPALALEEFTPREELLPTIEAILRVFDHNGNRENKLRARMKWLVDTLGWEEVQRQVLKERKFLLASSTWPGGIPDEVEKFGDAPAGTAKGVVPTPVGQGIEHTVPVAIIGRDAYARWEAANVVRGVGQGHRLGLRLGEARRHHLRPVPGAGLDPA